LEGKFGVKTSNQMKPSVFAYLNVSMEINQVVSQAVYPHISLEKRMEKLINYAH